jgi:crotonobetainyl-CoA:carnitine CoA-transferase CaiB-like acyl-CoA transferase
MGGFVLVLMQPLDDITVVDLSQSIAGPVCTQLLGEMGAEVIKVEPPEGDYFRDMMDGAMFVPFNHSKKSLSIDLKSDTGPSIIEELALDADVFVESFRPGVLQKYNLDYASLSQQKEDIIYCSISGFGQTGPYRDYPGFDPCVQAMSGLMATTGYEDRPPVRARVSLIDCGTGVSAAFAILSAIRQNDRGGGGTQIDISLFDVAVSYTSYWITNYAQTGEIPERAGMKGMGAAPNGTFETGNGSIYIACLSEGMYERLCQTLDRGDMLTDDRFSTMADRLENREELRRELTEEFRGSDPLELEAMLLESNIPAGAVKTTRDIVEEDRQIRKRSMITDSTDPGSGENVLVPSLPFRFSAGFMNPQYTSTPPKCGEHTIEVLSDLSYDEADIARLEADGTVVTQN